MKPLKRPSSSTTRTKGNRGIGARCLVCASRRNRVRLSQLPVPSYLSPPFRLRRRRACFGLTNSITTLSLPTMGRPHANDAPATLEVRDTRTGKIYSIP
jgi:hypothetical protein